MKFTIQRDLLLNALQKAQSVVEKKSTVAILANILCTVQDGQLYINATDLEVGVRIVLPVDQGENGRLTLSAKHFLDIVKELPSRPVQITSKENNWVEILSGKSRFNIVSLSADEYPALPAFDEKIYFDARVETLKNMIDRTAFSVSTDSTRYHLNGVYFEHLGNAVMRMTATDGHRLSLVDTEVFKETPDLKRGLIIPKKGLMELRRLLDSGSSTIGLAFERGYLFAQLNETHLFIRLMEGEYPDYRGVIPQSNERQADLDRETLNSALKRVSLLAHEKSRGVKLSLGNGVLMISSSNPDMGEARDEMDVDYKGEQIDIGFNAKYLLDCLSIMKSEKIRLSFRDRVSPGILREADQGNHTYVIMPMRI